MQGLQRLNSWNKITNVIFAVQIVFHDESDRTIY